MCAAIREFVIQPAAGGVSCRRFSGWPSYRKWFRAKFEVPAKNSTAVRKFRVKIVATSREKSWTSKPVKIRNENAADYGAYKKAAYNYMKPYCPQQIITLIHGRTSYAHYPSYQIDMSTAIGTGNGMKYVALHECAHIISYKLYSDNMDAMTARMNEIYGTQGSMGREYLADCMAAVMGGGGWGYYTKDCSGYRDTAARQVLAGRRP